MSVKVCFSDLGCWQTTAGCALHTFEANYFDDQRSTIEHPQRQDASTCGRTDWPQLCATDLAIVRPAVSHLTASCPGALLETMALVWCDISPSRSRLACVMARRTPSSWGTPTESVGNGFRTHVCSPSAVACVVAVGFARGACWGTRTHVRVQVAHLAIC